MKIDIFPPREAKKEGACGHKIIVKELRPLGAESHLGGLSVTVLDENNNQTYRMKAEYWYEYEDAINAAINTVYKSGDRVIVCFDAGENSDVLETEMRYALDYAFENRMDIILSSIEDNLGLLNEITTSWIERRG